MIAVTYSKNKSAENQMGILWLHWWKWFVYKPTRTKKEGGSSDNNRWKHSKRIKRLIEPTAINPAKGSSKQNMHAN